MLLIDVNNVYKSIGVLEILEKVSFKLYKRDKIGIVGKNGCGKTTLLKIIMEELDKDSGNISVHGKIGYLPQNLYFENDIKVKDFICGAYDYNRQMNLLEKFNLIDLMDQNISTLSGGEKTKLYFSKIISNNPDILILDEPTNNLDWESTEFIKDSILKFEGGVLMVSHDRFFLDEVVSKIYELDNKTLKMYSGNYTFYANEKKLEKERALLEYEEYRKKKKKLEDAAKKYMEKANRYNNISTNDFQRHKAAKVAKRSKAIISRLENSDEKEKPFIPKEINIEIDNADNKTSNILVRANSISKSFDRLIFKDVSFQIEKDNKIALFGKNGSGKSTILKAILNIEDIDGEISVSPSTKIGYFSQELKNLNWHNTIIEEIREINNDETYIRTILGSMLFRMDEVHKKIIDLSFGEKVRVAFAKLILEDNNLLLLDEPTNFLDIPTREAIEEALFDYKGAILFVSHDRYFIKKLAEEIWELEDGKMTIYLGNYDYYLNKKKLNNTDLDNKKEEILSLEMKLSYISFKLLSCSNEEKQILEKEYFELAKKLNKLKQNKLS